MSEIVEGLRRRVCPLPDGARLAVQESGRTDAPALLLLQGQANSHDWWTGLREAFDDSFRTITFDYRGTGGSQAVESAWSTRSFADDARSVLDACGVDRAHVYGTSMGGRVAQMLAIAAPERVARLVLACTSPGGAVARERSADVRRALAQSDERARRQALLELMYTPGWWDQGRSSHLLGDPTMTKRAMTLHLRASAGHDAADLLSQITAPTLVLHGSEDQMVPDANGTLIAEAIPDSELVITEGGRHGFFDEFAEETSRRVRRFLAA